MNEFLRQNLRAARRRAGLKQGDIAQQLGVSVVTYGAWERGTREPSPVMLQRVAEIVGVDIDTLTASSDPLAAAEIIRQRDELLDAMRLLLSATPRQVAAVRRLLAKNNVQ